MLSIYLLTSLLLFVPLLSFKCITFHLPSQVLVNEFSLCNSMWFTIGSLMQQGSDISPKVLDVAISLFWRPIERRFDLRPVPGNLHQDGGGHVVVLHPHHDLLLHSKPGRLPHCRKVGHIAGDKEGENRQLSRKRENLELK